MNLPEDKTPQDNSAHQDKTKALTDLPDNQHDEERMQAEEIFIDLPDVTDIPGQEHIVPPRFGELADITASSDDEEGSGLLDDNDNDFLTESDLDVSTTEKTLLEKSSHSIPGTDDTNLERAALDTTDFEGDQINEGNLSTDVSGSDLDVSGSEDDNAMEIIGEEDEENNNYSLGGSENDR